MAIITKIEAQKNNKDRVNIYLDGEFFKGIFSEIVYSQNLEEGSQINKVDLEKILKEEMFSKAKEKSFQILNGRHQSEKSLREKLYKRNYDKQIVDDVISYLKECSLINDEELADILVYTCLNVKKYGRIRIKDYLYKNKIKESIIENIFSSIDWEVELENATELARNKARTIKSQEHKDKYFQKLFNYLANKGYEYDIIMKAIKTSIESI